MIKKLFKEAIVQQLVTDTVVGYLVTGQWGKAKSIWLSYLRLP